MKVNTVDAIVVALLVLLTVGVLLWAQRYAKKNTGTITTKKRLEKVGRVIFWYQALLLIICPFLILGYLIAVAVGIDSITYLSTHQPGLYKMLLIGVGVVIIVCVLLWYAWGTSLTREVEDAFKRRSEAGETDSYIDPLTNNIILRDHYNGPSDPKKQPADLDTALEQDKRVQSATIAGPTPAHVETPHIDVEDHQGQADLTGVTIPPVTSNVEPPVQPVASEPVKTPEQPVAPVVEEQPVAPVEQVVKPQVPEQPVDYEQPVTTEPVDASRVADNLGNTNTMSFADLMNANQQVVEPEQPVTPTPREPVETTQVVREQPVVSTPQASTPVMPAPAEPAEAPVTGMSSLLNNLDGEDEQPVQQYEPERQTVREQQPTPVVPSEPEPVVAPVQPREPVQQYEPERPVVRERPVEREQPVVREQPVASKPVVKPEPADDFDLDNLFGLSAEEEEAKVKEEATPQGDNQFDINNFFAPDDQEVADTVKTPEVKQPKPDVNSNQDNKATAKPSDGIDLSQFL